jgi:uncharacterized phage protein (TIGR01671 family)
MREIKFRFWDKSDKKFRNPPFHYSWFSYSDIVPMQYTELKDNNGKEIYEGDILTFYNKFHRQDDFESPYSLWKVIYTDFGLYGKSGAQLESLSEFRGSDIVIIGNMFENPELLENDK